MNSDKAAYLAAHYLTVEKKSSSKSSKSKDGTSKKRKRKQQDGLLITEDDDLGWGTTKDPNFSDEDTPITVAGTSAEFRRTKKSSWKTVGAPIPNASETKDGRDEAAGLADAILAQAAAEKSAAAREADGEDDVPMVDADDDADVPMMADGTHAGLQSAKALSAQLRKRQKMEREELARLKAERDATKGADDGEPEIILRDATGRRVDISMRRAELRRAQLEAEKAEEAKKLVLKGEVQLEQARLSREALEDAKLMPLARGKDDEEMNRELKAQERWNDPMAQFLGEDSGAAGGKKGAGGSKRRLVYKGAAPPNRYGIRPGYRWDGVDRGTGFEAERFKAINRRERNKGLEYSWQMDV